MAEQGASNGAGQAAGKSFVSFSRGAAQRIAKAVRVVEAGDRNQPGLRFDHPQFGATAKLFRICTYDGSWSIGSTKTVTFKYQTTTPNTAVATNLFFPVDMTGTANCAIAKDGTAWFLVDVPFYNEIVSIVTSVAVSATLNTSNCSITVATTAGTSGISILRIGKP